jgi:hypothetical protein
MYSISYELNFYELFRRNSMFKWLMLDPSQLQEHHVIKHTSDNGHCPA